MAIEYYGRKYQDIYNRLSNGDTVYMTKNEMEKLNGYCNLIGDEYVLNNYISDEHIGNGTYKVYIIK